MHKVEVYDQLIKNKVSKVRIAKMMANIEQLRIEASKIPTYDNCVEILKRANCFYSTIEEIYDTKIEIFNYRMARFEDFCIPYSRNLRGITFDLNTKKLISLPLIKFFNYGENAYTEDNVLSQNKIVNVREKIDGSMISFFYLNNTGHNQKLFAKTQNTYKSWQAEKALSIVESNNKLKQFVLDTILEENSTPIFEFVSPNNNIVIYYLEDELIYLGKRNMISGVFIPASEDDLIKYGINDIKVPRSFDCSIKHLIDICKNSKIDFEGFVVQFNNGEMMKIKSFGYVLQHRASQELSNDKDIVEYILSGKIDDYKALYYNAPIKTNKILRIEQLEKIVNTKYNEYLKIANDFYLEHQSLPIIDYVNIAKQLENKNLFGLVMQLKNYGEIDEEKFKHYFVRNHLWESE